MTTTPLEAFVCREVNWVLQQTLFRRDFPTEARKQVFESFFYQDQPFNQRRHVIVTTALMVAATLGKSGKHKCAPFDSRYRSASTE